MNQFLKYYYFNLWRSKETDVPYGFIALGKIGIIAFRFLPFELLAYYISVFLLQWFCFGLTAEILRNFNLSFNGLFIPSIGLLISLFIFDFIHFNKSFYYNFKYRYLVNFSYNKLILLKTVNEILGGKIISVFVFFIFYVYYFDFSPRDLLLIFFVFFTYNSIILLFSKLLIKNNYTFVILFFSAQLGVLFLFDSNSLGFEYGIMKNEKWFTKFLLTNDYHLFIFSISLVVFQYIINLIKIKKDVFI